MVESWITHEEPDGSQHPLHIRQLKWMPDADLDRNVRANIKRPHPRPFDRPDALEIKNEPLAIVAGGPSLSRTLDQLREFKNVLVVASAHDFVSQAGISMTYALIGDGIPTMADYLRYPQKNCTYLLASQLDQKCFDAVEGCPVEIWHYAHQVEPEAFNGERALISGASCTIVAVQAALIMGYQHLHFFGFDCAFEMDTHAYPITDNVVHNEVITVKVGDEKTPIRTTLSLSTQALCFFEIVRSDDPGRYFHSTIHGGGLIAEMTRQGNAELRQRVAVAA